LPAGLSFEAAATIPTAGGTALQALRDKGQIKAGQRVLIIGAAGGVGSFAVQLAKYFKAHVTATCSTSKVSFVKSLGADHVIDYSKEDVTKLGQRYDLIIDIAAYRFFAAYKPIMTPKGAYVQVGGSLKQLFRVMMFGGLHSKRNGKRFGNVIQKSNQQNLLDLNEIITSGQVTPSISRCYPLAQVPDAMRAYGNKQIQGKVAITIGQ
jgi:NADPH:quinone reductase-like Zn-dependent oxidoreductase